MLGVSKLIFFLASCYVCWRTFKYYQSINKQASEVLETRGDTALDFLEEGSDFLLVEEGVWCWIEDGEPVTTKEFHLSRGGAIEDFERYIEGRKLH